MSGRNGIFLLTAVCLLMLLPNLDALPVNIMEARNFVTAREMAIDGNWILTTLNGEARYEKPPLPTWITACSGMLFGFENLYAMRIPVVLACLMLVYFAYRLSAAFAVPKRYAITSCLILITSFYVWFSGRDNQWDLYCHAFMLGGILYLWKLFKSENHRYSNAILSAVFIGFSMLSKGPVSAYGLLLPFLIAYFLVYRSTDRMRNFGALGLLIPLALAIGLSWPVYVRFADPDTFTAIAIKEATRWRHYNTRPFYYYWNFFLQSGIWAVPSVVALWHGYMKSRVSDPKTYRFTLYWTLASVILLSLVPEKKSRYLLPVLIPMAFNTAFYIEYLSEKFSGFLPRREKWPVYLSFGLLGIAGFAFPFVIFPMGPKMDASDVVWASLASIALVGCASAIFFGLVRSRFRIVFVSTVMLQVSVVVLAFPLSGKWLRPAGFRSVEAARKIAVKHSVRIYEFGSFSPEIVYAYGQKIPEITPLEATFGILAMAGDSINVKKTYPKARKVGFINLNTSGKRERQASNRLYRDLYMVYK